MITFGELVRQGVLAIGDGYRAKNEELGGDGPVFLRSAFLQDQGWALDQPERFARSDTTHFGSKIARLGDTVLTTKGNSLGRLGFVNESIAGAVYSPHLSYWRPLDTKVLLPRYLYYWAQSLPARVQIKARSESTDMAPYLSLVDQLAIKIELPSIKYQQAIADVLGSLDDKIESNRRVAETLETTTRTLFKSWFVDFDPVRAKAGGHSTGLSSNISALFPGAFNDEGLPTGFEVQNVGSELATSIIRGVAPTYAPTGILVVNQRCIRTRRVDFSKARFHDPSARKISDERLIQPGDMVVNSTGMGTLGRVAQIRHVSAPVIADSHVTIVRPNQSKISANMFGLSLLELEPLIETLGEGSTGQTELAREAVASLEIVTAPKPIQDAFDVITIPLRDRADAAVAEVFTLSFLRDTLLPKLISGKLRVMDAEKRIAAA